MKNLMKTLYKESYILLLAVFMCTLSACSSTDISQDKIDKGVSYINFTFPNETLSKFRTTSDQYDGDNETVTSQDEWGIPEEQKIYNLWVLLYSKGSSDNDSYLEYKYKFTLNGRDNIVNDENTYIDEDGKLTFGNTQAGSDYRHVYSSIKRVIPGIYKAVILVNTVFDFKNASFPQISNQSFNGPVDIMQILKKKTRWTPIPQKKLMPNNGSSLAEFKAATNNLFLNLKDEHAICPEELAKKHKDQGINRGIFSYYIDENFLVPKKGSKTLPFQKEIELKRWLSKIELYLTTTDANNEVYHRITGLQLENIQIENAFFLGKEKLFEWNTSSSYSAQSLAQAEAQANREFVKLKTFHPLLNTISEAPFSHQTKYKNQLFYTHYIPAYNNGAEKQEISFTDPTRRIIRKDTRTLVHLVFKRTFIPPMTNTPTTEKFDYYIPLFNPTNIAKPNYIESANWTKYTTLRNSIYRVYCVLQGPNRLNIEYELVPWDEKTIDLPAHE